ncbi:MAG: DUF6020 family protein [Acidimicrobiia bacterium]
MSSDTIDQLGQAASNHYFNHHPAIHTLLLDLSWSLFGSPGYLGLAQIVGLTVLMVVVARRLVRIGVNQWLAIGTVWLVALLPAVGATTVSLWKDVPFALGILWVFAELLWLAAEGALAWAKTWTPVRMGLALAVVWLFRHNGLLTVLPLLVVLAFIVRRRILGALGVLGITVVCVTTFLYPAFSVDIESIEPTQVFISDVAAVVVHRPKVFSESDLVTIEGMAPLDVWRRGYRCDDSTPLVFSSSFDTSAIDPAGFRTVLFHAVTRAPLTIVGHRLCVGSFLFSPGAASSGYLHRPPLELSPNILGIVREPISQSAYDVTRSVYVWAEAESRLWFTWSPAIPIVAALAGYGLAVARKSLRRWALPGLVLIVHTINVVGTSPAHEFRYAFPLYVVAWMSLPLLIWAISRSNEAQH